MNARLLKYVLLFFCVVSTPLFALAALEFPNLGEPVIIKMTPETVAPGGEVIISAESFLVDLDRSAILWLVDGKPAEGASNKKTFKTKAGALGSEKIVSFISEDSSGTRSESEIVLRPVELELLWESDSYTPPLYSGRAMNSPGSNMIAHALVRFVRANGATVPEGDIVYTWSFNGRVFGSASGRGHTTIKIPISGLYGDDIVSVDAVSLDGLFRATMNARAPSYEPFLVMFPYKPLFGIDYNNAVSNTAALPGREEGFAVIPYFSRSSSPRDRGLTYHWTIGGVDVPTDAITPFLITLALGDQSAGVTSLEVLLENSYNILQTVRRSWNITLGVTDYGLRDTLFTPSTEVL